MPPTATILCDLCDSEPATQRCLECARNGFEYLCEEDSKTLHKDGKYSGHKRIELQQENNNNNNNNKDEMNQTNTNTINTTTTTATSVPSTTSTTLSTPSPSTDAPIVVPSSSPPSILVNPLLSRLSLSRPTSGNPSPSRSPAGGVSPSLTSFTNSLKFNRTMPPLPPPTLTLHSSDQLNGIASLSGKRTSILFNPSNMLASSNTGIVSKRPSLLLMNGTSNTPPLTPNTLSSSSASTLMRLCDVCESSRATIFCDTCKRDSSIDSSSYCTSCNDDFHLSKRLDFHFRQNMTDALKTLTNEAELANMSASSGAASTAAASVMTKRQSMSSASGRTTPTTVGLRSNDGGMNSETIEETATPISAAILRRRAASSATRTPQAMTSSYFASSSISQPSNMAISSSDELQLAARKIQTAFRQSLLRRNVSIVGGGGGGGSNLSNHPTRMDGRLNSLSSKNGSTFTSPVKLRIPPPSSATSNIGLIRRPSRTPSPLISPMLSPTSMLNSIGGGRMPPFHTGSMSSSRGSLLFPQASLVSPQPDRSVPPAPSSLASSSRAPHDAELAALKIQRLYRGVSVRRNLLRKPPTSNTNVDSIPAHSATLPPTAAGSRSPSQSTKKKEKKKAKKATVVPSTRTPTPPDSTPTSPLLARRSSSFLHGSSNVSSTNSSGTSTPSTAPGGIPAAAGAARSSISVAHSPVTDHSLAMFLTKLDVLEVRLRKETSSLNQEKLTLEQAKVTFEQAKVSFEQEKLQFQMKQTQETNELKLRLNELENQASQERMNEMNKFKELVNESLNKNEATTRSFEQRIDTSLSHVSNTLKQSQASLDSTFETVQTKVETTLSETQHQFMKTLQKLTHDTDEHLKKEGRQLIDEMRLKTKKELEKQLEDEQQRKSSEMKQAKRHARDLMMKQRASERLSLEIERERIREEELQRMIHSIDLTDRQMILLKARMAEIRLKEEEANQIRQTICTQNHGNNHPNTSVNNVSTVPSTPVKPMTPNQQRPFPAAPTVAAGSVTSSATRSTPLPAPSPPVSLNDSSTSIPSTPHRLARWPKGGLAGLALQQHMAAFPTAFGGGGGTHSQHGTPSYHQSTPMSSPSSAPSSKGALHDTYPGVGMSQNFVPIPAWSPHPSPSATPLIRNGFDGITHVRSYFDSLLPESNPISPDDVTMIPTRTMNGTTNVTSFDRQHRRQESSNGSITHTPLTSIARHIRQASNISTNSTHPSNSMASPSSSSSSSSLARHDRFPSNDSIQSAHSFQSLSTISSGSATTNTTISSHHHRPHSGGSFSASASASGGVGLTSRSPSIAFLRSEYLHSTDHAPFDSNRSTAMSYGELHHQDDGDDDDTEVDFLVRPTTTMPLTTMMRQFDGTSYQSSQSSNHRNVQQPYGTLESHMHDSVPSLASSVPPPSALSLSSSSLVHHPVAPKRSPGGVSRAARQQARIAKTAGAGRTTSSKARQMRTTSSENGGVLGGYTARW